ncbi:peptidylprolyl isomerase [Clostridium hydrogeniformans]|uniref:peptidylprolyl isomerase n=1 Tax=Clostridium hydrogeniformans TaxID=349933 RepID=UPI00048237BD|nr:peptidylprolyl isomerase [Clostridium hydrogeniformans]
MKKVKKLLAAVMVTSMALSAVGCNMIQKTPEAVQKTVVGKVDGEKITIADVDERMKPIEDQLKKQYGDDFLKDETAKATYDEKRKMVLDAIVTEKVFLKKATELKFDEDKDKLTEEVDKQFNEIKEAYKDDEKFNEQIKAAGLTQESLKDMLKNEVLFKKVQDHIFKDVAVTDEAVKKFYDENKDTSFVEKPGAKLYHIIVKEEDKAKEIKAKLDKGGDFATLAKEYGTDGTKENGGELGFVEYDAQNYDKDFLEAARKLKEGEVSGVVKSSFGYHIIKATDLRSEPKAKEFDTVKDQIKAYLENTEKDKVYTSTIEQWKKDLKVETKEDKLK